MNRTWIGVHDQFAQGKFVTVLDEELDKVGYEQWGTIFGNKQPTHDPGQDCVALSFGDISGMDDTACSAWIPYICKFNEFEAPPENN